MGSELVSSSLSRSEGGEQLNRSAPFSTYTERFNEIFPYYLSIGMTYEQFWEQDCSLVIHYRKADEIKRQRRNEELWLQGMYIYEALCDVSPILHAFAKKGTKPSPYSTSPYALSRGEKEKQEEYAAEKKINRGKAFMDTFMIRNNKRFDNQKNNS